MAEAKQEPALAGGSREQNQPRLRGCQQMVPAEALLLPTSHSPPYGPASLSTVSGEHSASHSPHARQAVNGISL